MVWPKEAEFTIVFFSLYFIFGFKGPNEQFGIFLMFYICDFCEFDLKSEINNNNSKCISFIWLAYLPNKVLKALSIYKLSERKK